MTTLQSFDVVIIGAGGAGMMCAIQAGRRGRHVALIDHSKKIGQKILISGGGRCNFTNIYAGPDNYVSNNAHFCKSALAGFSPADFINMVEKHKIAYHEKKLGQLFCDGSAQNIVDMLVCDCRDSGASFYTGRQVRSVARDRGFIVETDREQFACRHLVIATGGLSVPQTGATGFGYKLAKQFGLKVIDPMPALDGFTLTGEQLKQFTELSGVSLDVLVSVKGACFRENILFTHNGLSGPASLQASLYWSPGERLAIDLQPDFDVYQWLLQKQKEEAQLKNVLSLRLPRRFAEKFCRLYLPPASLAGLSQKSIETISRQIHNWQIVPSGTVGFRKAEVTRGGVDTDELSSRSMECKKVPGLYFIGEVVDVTGWLGGYNFQWAWSSGFAAGQYV